MRCVTLQAPTGTAASPFIINVTREASVIALELITPRTTHFANAFCLRSHNWCRWTSAKNASMTNGPHTRLVRVRVWEGTCLLCSGSMVMYEFLMGAVHGVVTERPMRGFGLLVPRSLYARGDFAVKAPEGAYASSLRAWFPHAFSSLNIYVTRQETMVSVAFMLRVV